MSRFVLRGPHHRSGQALVEFAIVAFVTTILFAAILSFGLLIFGANVLQQAVDVGAQELARMPLSATASFDNALDDLDVQSELFDETKLVVALDTELATLPLINRLLFPLYIYDPDIDRLRYPGALVRNSSGDLTVAIPLVARDPTTGVETISEWHRVVEEIKTSSGGGPFSLNSTDTGSLDAGMVALRITYPYQSGALVAYVHPEPPGGSGVANLPVQADDSSVIEASANPSLTSLGYQLESPSANPNVEGSPNRGAYGLGEMQAHTILVRPYRKVVTAQAIYRREVFK